MAEGARVNSLDVLVRFRAAFADLGDQARLAMTNADSDIMRTQAWLQGEAQSHWARQIKARDKRLMEAKAELLSAEMQAKETRPSLVLERKRVLHAQMAVEEARQKLERVRHWCRVLDREIMLYKGQTQGFAGLIERNIPKGLARLATAMDRLQLYLKLAPPSGGKDASGAAIDADLEAPPVLPADAPADNPTDVPTDLSTDLPTDVPTDLPPDMAADPAPP